MLIMKFKNWEIGKHPLKCSSSFFKTVSLFSNKGSQGSLLCKTDEFAVVLGVKLVVSEEQLQKEPLIWSKLPFFAP